MQKYIETDRLLWVLESTADIGEELFGKDFKFDIYRNVADTVRIMAREDQFGGDEE